MATSDEFLIVESQDRIIRVQEFRVENDLDSIIASVEKLDATNLVQDWIISVVSHFVGDNWRERVPLECKYSSFKKHLVAV